MGRQVGQKTLEKIGRHMWMAPYVKNTFLEKEEMIPPKNLNIIQEMIFALFQGKITSKNQETLRYCLL